MERVVLSMAGKRVRRRFKFAGMTCGEIAYRAGLSRSHVWKIMHGERNPSLDALISLSQATGLSMNELVSQIKGKSGDYSSIPR